MRLLSLLLFSSLFTVLFPSALLYILPGEVGVNLVWMGLSVPLVWTAALYYSYWDDRPWRPTVVMGSASVVSALVVFLGGSL